MKTHRTRSLSRRLLLGAGPLFLTLLAGGAQAQGPGSVLGHQKISAVEGDFGGALFPGDRFGSGVAALGDLDGDGVRDLAVGSSKANAGAQFVGAAWVLFLESDGRVKAEQQIGLTAGGFTGLLDAFDAFGQDLTTIGDLDGDGLPELAVSALDDDDGGPNRGAVWILFLDSDGTVKSHTKISHTVGGFTGGLADFDRFGGHVEALGDLDGDGVRDLAVSAGGDDDGGPDRGAVWVLFLNANGNVKAHQKISDTEGGFTGLIDDNDGLGPIAALGDLDGDGIGDLALGASRDDDGGTDRGAVWVLFLNADGTVKGHVKISSTQGGFTGVLDDGDGFSEVDGAGDLDGDGVQDLFVTAARDDDGGPDRGALWVLLLNANGTVKAHQKVSSTAGCFAGALDDGDLLNRVDNLGDLNGDGVVDLALSAVGDDDGGSNTGAVWILFLDEAAPGLIGMRYCKSVANSTGAAALLTASGSRSVAANDLTLSASPVPNKAGIFFYGRDAKEVPFGNGLRCVAGPVVRRPITVASGNVLSYTFDNTNLPLAGPITPGSTWRFQAWFRDTAAGGQNTNLSDGLRITFCP